MSYFGNIGPTWDVAMTAAESDSHASIIQRPRIQTSQAKPAQFFVGSTVPYVTGTTYGSYAYGNSSSYSQLSVGVELDVTPFINPDGLVVMDIKQEIDDINGYTTIDGNGKVPNTDKRTLSSEIAVRDRDTIMLGGFIRSDKSTSRSGVPFLQDIPDPRQSVHQPPGQQGPQELIVLMRPTVLRTPEIAAAKHHQGRDSGCRAFPLPSAEDAAYENKLIEAERKGGTETRQDRGRKRRLYNAPATNSYAPQSQDNGFFNPPPPVTPLNTNTVAPLNP